MYFSLIRKCSEYSYGDILLGIYDSIENANNAKIKYINMLKNYDKFSKQAYHKVNLEDDVQIEQINVKIINNLEFIYYLVEAAKVLVKYHINLFIFLIHMIK